MYSTFMTLCGGFYVERQREDVGMVEFDKRKLCFLLSVIYLDD